MNQQIKIALSSIIILTSIMVFLDDIGLNKAFSSIFMATTITLDMLHTDKNTALFMGNIIGISVSLVNIKEYSLFILGICITLTVGYVVSEYITENMKTVESTKTTTITRRQNTFDTSDISDSEDETPSNGKVFYIDVDANDSISIKEKIE